MDPRCRARPHAYDARTRGAQADCATDSLVRRRAVDRAETAGLRSPERALRGRESMMTRRLAVLVPVLFVAALVVFATPAGAVSAESKVTVGSPATPYLPNGSNEPALAMDANHPAVLAAGANDLVDNSPCKGSSCDLTPDIGISGVYFSFDSGGTWTQPTYTGLTAQNGTTHVGPIHTLPGYFEHGMSSHGDPALAFGPRPGPGGFSWANGSRLYYANLAFNLSTTPASRVLGGRGVAHRQRAGGRGRRARAPGWTR